MSTVTDTCTGSVGAVALDTVTLAVVVAKVSLQVEATADGSTTSALGFLLEGRALLREPSFRSGY